jgi:sporulation protein YlmC with PRC-barrel domain
VNGDAAENRLSGPIDGALQLLDRQILDSDGKMVGKVDDVELTQQEDGLAITALLVGTAALLHRLGGQLGNEMVTKWVQLRVPEPLRARPWRVDMTDVDRLDSGVHLSVSREGVLDRDTENHRLGRLTGMEVLGPGREHVGRVLDARFEPGMHDRLVIRSLLVGRGHPGSLLGYDRHPRQGPTLIRGVVRWMHRHTRPVDIDDAQILWNNEQVHLRRLPDAERDGRSRP